MIRPLGLAFAMISSVALASTSRPTREHKEPKEIRVVVERETHTPIRTESCVRKGQWGCSEYDHSYTVPGASCLADCVVLDSYGKCRLRNTCTYDAKSGCFTRNVCDQVDSYSDCAEWRQEVSCG